MSNSNTKFVKISFNGKEDDSITDCDGARKYLEIVFFFKSLTCLPFASECVCCFNLDVLFIYRERSGSVVECLTRDRRAAGSSLTGVTALWSLSKTHLS